MDGLYLYCLREKTNDTPRISVKGVGAAGEVFVFPYRQLEAVVSRVSLDELGCEEIQRRAREDLKWIKERCLAHETVVEEAMMSDGKLLSVIPMRFGTVFKEKTKLEETLSEDYARIRNVLERIRGKREWSVKVYLTDREKLEQAVRERNEAVKEKEKEIASLPEGMAFFMEEELKQIIAEQVGKELSESVNRLFDRLARQSVSSVKTKILAKELTGKREPMVLNSAHLVGENGIESFKQEVEELRRQVAAKGFALECSGPWPAFNFTSY